jgi:hypothetical protein
MTWLWRKQMTEALLHPRASLASSLSLGIFSFSLGQGKWQIKSIHLLSPWAWAHMAKNQYFLVFWNEDFWELLDS